MAHAAVHKIRIRKEHCKGCELCLKACPRQVLRMSRGNNARGLHYAEAASPELCIGCLQCCDICPDAAIEIFREES